MGPWGVVLDSLWGTDAPDTTHTDVLALSVFLCVSVFVFSIVSGDSLGDPVEHLGPHMLCTPMFQRFALFSAECVLGGSLGRPWGCLWDPQGFLVGPRGVLEAPRGSLETLRGVLGCSGGLLGRLLGGSLGGLGESLSGPSAPYATHTDVSAFSVFRCSCVFLLDYFLLSRSSR